MKIKTLAIVALLAFTGLCREKIPTAAGVSPVSGSAPAVAPATKVSFVLKDILPASEVERLAMIKYSGVIAIAVANGIPYDAMKGILAAAYGAGVPDYVLADILRIAASSAVGPATASDIAAVALSQGVPSEVIVSVLSALKPMPGVPAAVIADIMAQAQASGVDPYVISQVVASIYAIGVSKTDIGDIQTVATAVASGMNIASVASLMIASGIVSPDMPENTKAAAVERLSLKLSDIAMLAAASQSNKSRWDVLYPSMFSTLWDIKRRGKAADADGRKEESDRLWNRYWTIFVNSRH